MTSDIIKKPTSPSYLEVKAQNIPNMTLKVDPGTAWIGDKYIRFPGGTSPVFTRPSFGKAKFTILCLTNETKLILVDGEENITPIFPSIPKNAVPLSVIFLNPNTNILSNEMIFDIRPDFYFGNTTMDHNDLLNRNINDAHDIASITGLQTELDKKIEETKVIEKLTIKCGLDEYEVELEPDEDSVKFKFTKK